MPGQDDINSPADRAREDGKERPHLSRRSILRGAAGAGAAGIAAAALAGTAMPAFAAASGPAHDTKDPVTDTSDQIVVHVRDARSGEIDVFRGTSQTRLRDPQLAARLVRASR
jgi:anaerobic selenocysteine-containing dehydrogenase